MIQYRKARKEEADDLLDFINYVFSLNQCPHDFKMIDPKMYASEYPFWKDHYVAMEDGHIRATIALTKEYDSKYGMTSGHIGQVSVHPYHRGKNYMRVLMNMAIEDMKKERYDYSILSGQRQRYGYFGYEPGDYRFRFEINATNIRHVLERKSPIVTIKKEEDKYSFWKDEKQVGTWEINRPIMEDESLIVDALGAYMDETEKKEICIEVPLYKADEAEIFARICENASVAAPWNLIQIFNFCNFIEIGLRKRAQAGLCDDGEMHLQVGKERFGLKVKDGQVSSFDLDQADCVDYFFQPSELQRMVLSMTATCTDKRFPRGWFPISL